MSISIVNQEAIILESLIKAYQERFPACEDGCSLVRTLDSEGWQICPRSGVPCDPREGLFYCVRTYPLGGTKT